MDWRERFEAPSLIASSYLIPTEPPCLAELERIQVQGAAKMNPGEKRIRHNRTLKFRMNLIKETAASIQLPYRTSLVLHPAPLHIAPGIHAALT